MNEKTIAHTPGPWTLQGEGIVSDPTTGGPIITTRIETEGGWGKIEIIDGTNEPTGNALLINAAPELLAAVNALGMALRGYQHQNAITKRALATGKEAIAKATGKSPSVITPFPDLPGLLDRLATAAANRENTMGDLCHLLHCQAQLADAIQEAREALRDPQEPPRTPI